MPLYQYWCHNCNRTWDEFMPVELRDTEVCKECNDPATRQLAPPARPVVYEYYSESLDEMITGPAQKARIMKQKGVSEVG